MSRFTRMTTGPFDGYVSTDGRIEITDNGAGMGRTAGSGRWAVTIDGHWLANIDTLAAAKRRATDELDALTVIAADEPMSDEAPDERTPVLHRGRAGWLKTGVTPGGMVRLIADDETATTLTARPDDVTPVPQTDADWAALSDAALIAMCTFGNDRACDELDRRGVDPPIIEPDADPIAGDERASTDEGFEERILDAEQAAAEAPADESTDDELTDDEALELLKKLARYFRAYPDESPQTMYVCELAGDLRESLPAVALSAVDDADLEALGFRVSA